MPTPPRDPDTRPTSELLPSSVDFGQVVYPPGSTYGPRRQLHVQIVLVHRGSADVTLDGEAHIGIRAGEAALLRPGRVEYFQFDCAAETHHSWVHLAYGDDAPALPSRLRPVVTTPIGLDAMMRAALQWPAPTHGLASRAARTLGVAMLEALLEAARFGIETTEHPPPVPLAIERAERVMRARLAEPLRLADLAAAASVTPSHLVRLYRQHRGTTPIRRLWQVRARHGIDLLRDTGLSVSEIAYRVGCQSPYHFSRLIRRHAGAPPTELRQRLWNA